MYVYRTTVTLRDADAAGVLFFARYLALAHDAYEAFMAEGGLSTARIIREESYVVPVVHAEADYKRPLQMGERVEIRLQVTQVRRRSFRIHYELCGEGGATACTAETHHVAVDKEKGKAVPLPERLADLLRANLHEAAAE
jgi:1,4-dihydroxy-2-naphthoyl-CoA hydrolase